MTTRKYLSCQIKAKKDYYARNADEIKRKAVENSRKRAELVRQYKEEAGCCWCGDTRHYVLVFHHRDPSEKSFTISTNLGKSLPVLMEEIAKCDVMCANCHRELHYLERT